MSRTSRQAFLLILSYTTLAVAWGWRLHAQDRRPDAAHALLETARIQVAARLARAPAHLRQAALFQLSLLPEGEVRALQEWGGCAPEQRLRQLTVRQGPVHAPSPLHTALLFAELNHPEAPPPDDTRLLISAAGDRLEETAKLAALALLASQATAARDFNVALEIHLRISESPAVDWPDVLALVDAARQARRPAAALRVVGVWLDPGARHLDAAQREDALDLQTALLLEGGRHAEAARLVLEDLRALKPADAIKPRLLERALLAAAAADESVELLPWLERHLRTFPAHQLSIGELAGGKSVIPADYLRWLRESTLIADRRNQTSIACDGFFRLAAAGEIRVLGRLHPLATQIGRGTELAQLLAGLGRRFKIIDLARAMAEGGMHAPAHDLLITHLKQQPGDREGWRLLTQTDVTLRGEATAPGLWQAFLKRFPEDVPALSELARLQLHAAQLPQALRTLQDIPGEHLDEPTLRQITALAIQLDDLATAHRAQQLLVQGTSSPGIRDVMLLAGLTRQHADAESQAALAEAIARLPSQSAFQKALLIPATTGEATHFDTAAQAR